jgi:hypothetical protein
VPLELLDGLVEPVPIPELDEVVDAHREREQRGVALPAALGQVDHLVLGRHTLQERVGSVQCDQAVKENVDQCGHIPQPARESHRLVRELALALSTTGP